MGPFVPDLRGKFNRFLSDIQLLQYLIVFFGLFNLSLCLYEDQVGKFDWRQNYVGKIKFASFDTVSAAKKIIVATEENVVAALNLKSGQILWRRVLEQGCAGHVRALGGVSDGDLITVSGGVPAIVRAWDLATGHILNEWPLAEQNPERLDSPLISFNTTGLYDPERIEDVMWHIKDGTLHHILPTYNGDAHKTEVEVTSYDSKTGEKLKSRKIDAAFISKESTCVLAVPYIACIDQPDLADKVYIQHLYATDSDFQAIPVIQIFGSETGHLSNLESVPGDEPVVSVSRDNGQTKRIIVINTESAPIPNDLSKDTALYITTADEGKVLLQTSFENQVANVAAVELSTFSPIPNLSVSLSHNSIQAPTIVASICPRQPKGTGCRHLLSSEDHSVALLQHSRLVWLREEALANIVAVEMMELPMSDREQAIETEFDQKENFDVDGSWDVVSMMVRRICSQANQLKGLLQAVMGFSPPQSTQRADLVRDEFGLHKMIVAVTSAGKIYGIESKRGEIIWQLRVKNITGFSKASKKMVLYVQRGSRHFPHPPQCALLAADKETGNGVIYTFNPMTGQPLGEVTRLGYKIKQSMLLHVSTDDFLRPIILFDTEDFVHAFPESAKATAASVAKSVYIFTADQETGVLSGFSLAYSTPEELIAHMVWQVILPTKTQQIVDVVSKSTIERVHSQGRVLGDRSVLYKYINPNLVAIVVQGVGSTHKNTLTLYLLDVVSGAMVFSVVHKRVRGPFHVVHSENWLVYSYFNEKSRRTEIATMELYEGKTQSNTTAFSSLTTTVLPIVERQAFIFPASIEFLRETITEKGITSKHIMVALANGGILELPWMLVDPRRPINPEMREEGVIPYMPEIPIQMDAIVNYNQSIARVSGIHTSPSGLESTCLVFVYGLDLFYTRVAPSKTFDVLKEDFDYYLITIVLLALTVSSYVTKKLASRKAQKQAWK
ncbi:ER membrane protein complex subunit 1 isoform X1 [Neodiprion pinetum]|uniref:ER membrane protein complex subunit 1 isoform X1 n=1 Tax=Neodiprion pinetum TaxID=441929 RepID=UPI001EE0CCF4|nr:ER membrane protein complex subunit 1 isoform X1 [Neodiprion pinetum]